MYIADCCFFMPYVNNDYSQAIAEAEAEAEADPACNNCGQRPPYIKGARVSAN